MPIPSCPPEILELMTTPVTWEQFLGFDGHAEPSYAPALTLTCYQESHAMTQGGLKVNREADSTQSDPDWDLFFAGDDLNAQQFTLYDRFTSHSVGDRGFSRQPTSINTVVGPPFDAANPWLIVVTLD